MKFDMIKEKYIDTIKSRVDISQLVMDLCPGTSLLNAGKNRKKCCCVFHSEKTPSLMLDLSLNMLSVSVAAKVATSLVLSRS